jgi:DNA primase small subunit
MDAVSSDYSGLSFDEKMRVYYSKLFPYEPMHQWLSYGGSDKPGDVFSKREFSFTLKNDIYCRFLSYSGLDDWKADMIKKVPHKIDMGAVYTKEPNQKNYISKESFKEVAREFILDIDLTDYQEDKTIKSNCIDPTDTDFCKSWKFMRVACKVLDAALREDFGFEHLLWVFSGRRGIHCWVADERARLLPDNARSAVAEYLNVFKGGDKDKTKLDAVKGGYLGRLHPALERAYEGVLYPEFEELLEDQGWLDRDSMEHMLDLVGDADIKSRLLEKWQKKKNASGTERWEELQEAIRKKFSSSKGGSQAQAQEMIKFIVFKLTYPRLDIAVSKMMNHLLKSPFCVHPKTHLICVPLDAKNIGEFDPNDVPSLEEVLADMECHAKRLEAQQEDGAAQANTAKRSRSQMHSSPKLDRYVKVFKNQFLNPLIKDVGRELRQARAESGAIAAF